MAGQLIVALDVSSRGRAEEIVSLLGDAVDFYKIGYQCFYGADGFALGKDLLKAGKKVFFDLKLLDIDSRGSDFTEWEEMVDVLRDPRREVEVALVGKYIDLQDAYKSKYEALTHGGVANHAKVKVRRVAAEAIEDEGPERLLEGVSGVLVGPAVW